MMKRSETGVLLAALTIAVPVLSSSPAQALPIGSSGVVTIPSAPVFLVAERSTSARRPDPAHAAVERLNDESLQRARQGVSSPSPGPDTTQNLNRLSDQDAKAGRSPSGAPMPFR